MSGCLPIVLVFAVASARAEEPNGTPDADPARLFRLGEKFELKGHTFYVAKRGEGRITLSAPQPPTASIGAFIKPVAAHASNWQENAGRSPQKSGAQTDDNTDDSDAIQAAIDSGATTVYLPRGRYAIGKTIVIRGKVQRIVGCRA